MFSVLLVDDEELVRVSIRYAISTVLPDVRVIGEAANGAEGLEVFSRERPDIVITDIRMPRMDGLEMIAQLRRETTPPQVIVLSGYADFEYARQAMKLGVTDYLLKPVESNNLRETVGACIARICAQRNLTQEETSAQKVIAYIDAHYAEELFLDKLAEQFNFSTKYLSALIKRRTGQTFTAYLTGLRLDRARDLLQHTDMEIKEVASAVGYDDHRYFHRIFKKTFGKTPSQYRR